MFGHGWPRGWCRSTRRAQPGRGRNGRQAPPGRSRPANAHEAMARGPKVAFPKLRLLRLGPAFGRGLSFTSSGGLPLACPLGRSYMASMKDHFGKPVRAAVAGALIGTFALDVVDGAVDFDYDGPAKIIEATMSSAPSSGPQFSPSYVVQEDTIIGGIYEVIPPEDQCAGAGRPAFSQLSSLDDLLARPTDVSGGQAILRDWTTYST